MYDYLVFDTVNIGYMVYNSANGPKPDEMRQSAIKIGSKRIYRLFLKNYLETVDYLRKKFLNEGGELVFLFDNYTSRDELRQMLKPLKESDSRKDYNPDYKAGRKSQKAEFYNTLDTLRYYYLVGDTDVHTVRIPNLEADDLVKPCLSFLRAKKPEAKVLLCTNDSDWCRYLDSNTSYLPELYKEPVGKEKFFERWGYHPTEDSIVLYKLLYGDDADNVKPVFPEFDSKIKRIIMDKFSSIVDFMFDAGSVPELKEYVTLIKDREVEVKIAYQMLAAIPVSDAHFKQVWTTGRKSIVMRNQLNTLIFDQQEENDGGFVFGAPIPRYTPKGK